MIAAATATNKEAAIRILANPRGTLPPEVSLSSRPGRCQARGYDFGRWPAKFWPGTAIIRWSILAAGLPAALIKKPRRPRQSPGLWPLACRRVSCCGRKRPGRRGIAAETAQHLERPWSLPVCVSPPPPWARLFCCRQRPRYWLRAATPRGAPGPKQRGRREKDAQRKFNVIAEAAKVLGGLPDSPNASGSA
jgi:hypothetical protein